MPLVMPNGSRCWFCCYLAGELPYTILEHGAVVSMLVTREQRGIGHVLVIPTAHRPTVLDLAVAEHGPLLSGVQRAAVAIGRAYDPAGVSVWQKNGVSAFQTVSHTHFHVAGTLPSGGTGWGPVPKLDIAETDVIAARLRAHLPRPDEPPPYDLTGIRVEGEV